MTKSYSSHYTDHGHIIYNKFKSNRENYFPRIYFHIHDIRITNYVTLKDKHWDCQSYSVKVTPYSYFGIFIMSETINTIQYIQAVLF